MGTSLWDLLREYKVVIPILQRDYAQGRTTGKVPLIRNNILNALCNSINSRENALELDFIYGYTKSTTGDENGEKDVFLPLDGQQRLTTLFLFHWFIAVKEGHLEEATNLLAKFTYEIRHSSWVFCSELVKYNPESFDIPIKQNIINQPWFFTAWTNDPTINSMLTMLNAIQDKVAEYELENVWESLVSEKPAVVFHLLPMDKLGLPDDLYIKMNSRGKELTDFEYFKIRFSELLTPSKLIEFNHKIDQEWSDLFWDIYKEEMVQDIAQKVDAAFLRFFRCITDIIIAKNNFEIPDGIDEFEIFKKLYLEEENVKMLFSILDLFVLNKKTNPDYFSSFFYIMQTDYTVGKTRMFFINASTDLFKKCSDSYDSNQRNNPFSMGEQLLLYAFILQLQNKTNGFSAKIRRLRNLITNSADTLRKENMAALLNSVFEIVINNTIDSESKFNKTQIKEEEDKALFIQENPQMIETICQLEDHLLLQGCIAIFKLTPDLNDYAMQFQNVFYEGCDYDSISCALLTFGDYSQKFGLNRRLGNKNGSVWRELFTPSMKRGDFQNTHKALYELFGKLNVEPSSDIKAISSSYLALFQTNQSKEKDWKYYFIQYPEFRNHEDGFYYWPDNTKQYECIMLRRQYLNGFHWDPFLAAIKKGAGDMVNLENYGAPLIFVKGNATLKITNHNDCFKLEASEADGQALLNDALNAGLISSGFICMIKQSPVGFDEENRIEKGVRLIDSLNKL